MIWEYFSKRLYHNSYISDNLRKISYKDFFEDSIKVGNKLSIFGNKKKVCCILCESELDSAIAIFGCWYCDYIAVPLTLNYGIDRCRTIIQTIKPDILIISTLYQHTFTFDGNIFNISNYEFVNRDVSNKALNNRIDIDSSVALIMCTSGTTGIPKGILLSDIGLIKNVKSIGNYVKPKKNDTILICRPLAHSSVLTSEFLLSILKGINIIFSDTSFNPFTLTKYILNNLGNVICGTATLFFHLSNFIISRNISTKSVHIIHLSGEGVQKEVSKKIRKAFPNTKIFIGYGMTEASARISYLPYKDFDSKAPSAGKPIKRVKIKIMNNDFKKCKPLEEGLIYIKSQSLMKGYLNNTELTLSKFKNGWFCTGDVGYLDSKHYLYVLGRKDDLIIKGGMNIYPSEIENIVNALNIIEDSYAYRINTPIDQQIGLFVKLKKEYLKINYNDVVVSINQKLPTYLIPDKIEIGDEIPRNASGKKLRISK